LFGWNHGILEDPFATSLEIHFKCRPMFQIGGRRMQIADEEGNPLQSINRCLPVERGGSPKRNRAG